LAVSADNFKGYTGGSISYWRALSRWKGEEECTPN
jgi:hypothetical protein